MSKSKKVQISNEAVKWDDPKISELLENGEPFQIEVLDPRFSNPIKRRYTPNKDYSSHWERLVGSTLANKTNPTSKLLRVYKAVTLSEEIYKTKVKPLKAYWSLTPAFEDDIAVITGSGRSITEAFDVLGAMIFLGQQRPPQTDELYNFPYVCSLKTALQYTNSFGESDRIEGVSRSTEMRVYYKSLLITEFQLSTLSPRVQQALLFLLQDRESHGLLTLLHIADFDTSYADDSPLVNYLQQRAKIV